MKKFLNNIKIAWSYASDNKFNLFMCIIFNIIKIVINVILPILSAKVIISLTNNEWDRILIVAVMIFICDSLSIIMYSLSRIYAAKIYRKSLANLEIDLGKNILKIENKCLDINGSGVFIERFNDTSKIADAFQYLLIMTSDLIKYIGVLIAIFIVNKIVFIYVLSILIILNILESKRGKIEHTEEKIIRKYNDSVTSFVGELVRGAKDIKMLNSEKDFIGTLSNKINEFHLIKLKQHKKNWLMRLGIWEIFIMFDFIMIILLVILMKNNLLLPSIALILYNYYENISGSAYFFDNIVDYIKEFNLSCERVYEIISDKYEKEVFGSKHIGKVEGDFEFKNVSFGYNDKLVLDNINFKINKNETVAFVGKSGAGKSTIFSLLCKMYDINSGEITIDNINIKELDKDTIRGNITIISQNPYIFNMSIRDNLKLVKNDLTDEEMINACKTSCLDDLINKLPNGYDTIVGEGGVTLSGGEKQRLAIARALVQKTEIILFDEATSALDNETQNKIKEAIDNMKNEYTILIIAHRLSTIINSDRILVLDDGKVINEGTHEYLVENCDKYSQLYEKEFKIIDN